MTKHAAIVGAGIMGLLTARELLSLGWRVTVYEKLPQLEYRRSTSFAAGGMLAPFSELESADELIFKLGVQSLSLWQEIIDELPAPIFFKTNGTLFLSHQRDIPHFENATRRIFHHSLESEVSWIQVADLEPELGQTFNRGIYLPKEGHIDNRQLIPLLASQLEADGVRFLFGEIVQELRPYVVETAKGSLLYDIVVDCRGIGAAADTADLRGVRGEAFLVHAPDVGISRPVRLMHPRYAVYIVPRANNQFYIGATSIESASESPVTVRSSLELLSAAYSVHSGFGEASILEVLHGIRPAFKNNAPRISFEAGLVSINGLYRHGFLLSPVLARAFKNFLEDETVEYAEQIFSFVRG
ncbi:MAG: glycine oxidase ThiO [Proteobacteria bacterium]|nr:MAG: glycine oxidase ThiO [Pseudomonadota bacterium]